MWAKGDTSVAKSGQKTEKAASLIRSRIVGHGDVNPEELLANPLNFRRHPGNQMEALRGSMKELGWIKTILVNKTTGHVIDGHARVEEAMRQGLPTIPVTLLELTPEEERLALAVLDPITELAHQDAAILSELLAQVETEDAGLLALLNKLDPDTSDNDIAGHYHGMPEFEQEAASGVRIVVVHFRTEEDVAEFFRRMEQDDTGKTKSIWWPRQEREDFTDREYSSGK